MNRTLVILGLMLLSACNQPTLIPSAPIQIDIARAADPPAVSMLPVQFRVITGDNLDTFVAEIRNQQGGATPVFIAMRTQDYENLALNLADLRRYIEQQRAVIVYYRNMTARTEPVR